MGPGTEWVKMVCVVSRNGLDVAGKKNWFLYWESKQILPPVLQARINLGIPCGCMTPFSLRCGAGNKGTVRTYTPPDLVWCVGGKGGPLIRNEHTGEKIPLPSPVIEFRSSCHTALRLISNSTELPTWMKRRHFSIVCGYDLLVWFVIAVVSW